jgi:hypothetical protein
MVKSDILAYALLLLEQGGGMWCSRVDKCCLWDARTCSRAAAAGVCFELLQQAHKQGCPRDAVTYYDARVSMQEYLATAYC